LLGNFPKKESKRGFLRTNKNATAGEKKCILVFLLFVAFMKKSDRTVNRQPADSSYEEDNADPDSPDVPTRTWIICQDEDEPVPLDQLSARHEK